MSLNIDKIRKDFPILNQQIYGKPLIYLDSAASAQKPLCVLEKEKQLYLEYYGNIHRGAHYMADKATEEFENTRNLVRNFINAGKTEEIIFTKGTTESINLVAFSFGEEFVSDGDEIIVSEMEHHANIVPWQIMAQRRGAIIKVLPFNTEGVLEINELDKLLTNKTKLVAITHVSNTLGTINPIKQIIDKAHKFGAKVLIDGAQAIPHIDIDVEQLNCDFYVFSAHKLYGPNGVGILYGKQDLLNAMPPYQGGGEMIKEVSFKKTIFNELPYKYEAGTPNIIGVIAFGEAIKYIDLLGKKEIAKHEHNLIEYATKQMMKIDGMTIYGTAPEKSGVITFNIDGIHPFDLSTMLDKMGIALRAGRMCADTVMDKYNITGAMRISFAMYNTTREIDCFILAINKLISIFRR